MAESVAKTRQRQRQLGNSLWGIVDVRASAPCREPVQANEATLFVMQSVLGAVSSIESISRPQGFIGIAGESRFLRTQFPENLMSIMSSQIELMVQSLLNQPSKLPVCLSGDQYTIAMVFHEELERVREWLGKLSTYRWSDVKTLAPDKKVGQTKNQANKQSDFSSMSTYEDKLTSLLQEISKESPQDFVEQAQQFSSLGHRFRTTVATLLQGPLNTHLQTLPQQTPHDKQALATWVNAQLRGLGLAVQCPKTKRPSVLISDLKEGGSEIGRFRFENRDERGVKVRSWTSTELPVLELMEDVPRKEPLLDWKQRTSKREPRKRD